MSDIVKQIKESIDITQLDLGTAEGRLELDTQLNAAVAQIEGDLLRNIVFDMLKGWRRNLLAAQNPPHVYHSAAKVQAMLESMVPTPAEIVGWIRAADGRTYDDFAEEIAMRLRAKIDQLA